MSAGFCTDCGQVYQAFDELESCARCGSRAVPCATADQCSVSINWHELRILVIWAENWQRQHQLGRTVYAIASRITQQFPERAQRSPLTLAADIGQLAAQYDVSVSDPHLRRDIAEQTGEETI